MAEKSASGLVYIRRRGCSRRLDPGIDGLVEAYYTDVFLTRGLRLLARLYVRRHRGRLVVCYRCIILLYVGFSALVIRGYFLAGSGFVPHAIDHLILELAIGRLR